MEYYAKSENSQGHQETVREHLQKVAALAREYGEALGLADAAKLGAHVHDFGKYTKASQDVLKGTRTGVDHVDHSSAIRRHFRQPVDVVEFRWLLVVENDHRSDLAVVIPHIEHAVFDSVRQSLGAWEDPALVDRIGFVLFLILKMLVEQRFNLWHIVECALSDHNEYPQFFMLSIILSYVTDK